MPPNDIAYDYHALNIRCRLENHSDATLKRRSIGLCNQQNDIAEPRESSKPGSATRYRNGCRTQVSNSTGVRQPRSPRGCRTRFSQWRPIIINQIIKPFRLFILGIPSANNCQNILVHSNQEQDGNILHRIPLIVNLIIINYSLPATATTIQIKLVTPVKLHRTRTHPPLHTLPLTHTHTHTHVCVIDAGTDTVRGVDNETAATNEGRRVMKNKEKKNKKYRWVALSQLSSLKNSHTDTHTHTHCTHWNTSPNRKREEKWGKMRGFLLTIRAVYPLVAPPHT